MGQSRVVGMLIGVLLVIAVIWFSMWLGDLPRCAFTPTADRRLYGGGRL
jgi:hypothetical protein